jgi:hypothetical protein
VLAFLPPSLTMAAGVCTQVTVQAQDTLGNPSRVTGDQLITFSANPATGFSVSIETDCSSPGTQFNIFNPQSSRVLYMRGTATGDVTLTASRAVFTSGALTVKVNPGAPSRLAFRTASQTVQVGNCSGITTIQVQDSYNNATPVSSNTQIDLTASTGTLVFYADAACNNPAAFVTLQAGQQSASFHFKGTTAGAFTLTASSTGLTSATQSTTITTGSQAAIQHP